MAKQVRRISFEEFAAHMPDLLERITAEHETVIVEKNGNLYRIEATTEGDQGRPRTHDPERFREMLSRTAGALKGVDIVALKRDLRAGRQQGGRNRPQ